MRFDACPEGIPEFRLRGFYNVVIHNPLKSFLIIYYDAVVLYGQPPNILLGTTKKERTMKKFLWILVIVGSIFGGLMAFIGVAAAQGAPQEAAAAAMGVAFTVIPYCLARAVSEMGK